MKVVSSKRVSGSYSDKPKAAPQMAIQKRPRRRRLVGLVTLVSAFALCGAVAQAQQPKKIYRVGYLTPTASSPTIEAFRQGLLALGYVEGQNIIIEWRFTKGDASQFPGFAGELVRLKVACIVTEGIPAIRAAKQATSTIPIVMHVADDPVQMGLIESLARPGGNITGFTNIGAELAGKRLELLKEAFPKVSRVGLLWSGLSGKAHFREIEAPARALRLQLKPLEMKGPGDLENSFRTAGKDTDAVMVVGGGWMNSHRARIVNLAVKTRLPAMYHSSQFVLEGGLMSYGADSLDQYRRAAIYVDKILKGAKPADLPVEQPMKFEFIINLKAAKQIGLTIPPNVLVRADSVIK
jgi:putative ABC transport system substrate-binding protein